MTATTTPRRTASGSRRATLRSARGHTADQPGTRTRTVSPDQARRTPSAPEHGVLYSHAYNGCVEPAGTRAAALVRLGHVMTAQPGIQGEVMIRTRDGWRSARGETPSQVVARRWSA